MISSKNPKETRGQGREGGGEEAILCVCGGVWRREGEGDIPLTPSELQLLIFPMRISSIKGRKMTNRKRTRWEKKFFFYIDIFYIDTILITSGEGGRGKK